MSILRGLLAAVACVALVSPAFAGTSLCVETGAVGFNWQDGKWIPTTFNTSQYLVQEMPPDDTMSGNCKSGMARFGLSTEPVTKEFYANSWGCFSITEVGLTKQPMDVSYCSKALSLQGELISASCDAPGFTQYYFHPTGEFSTTRTTASHMQMGDGSQRDSMVMSVGKCSVVTP